RAAAPVAAALCATGALLVTHGAAQVAIASVLAFAYLYAGSGARFGGVEWVGHTLFALLALLFVTESSEVPRVAFDAVAWAQLLEIVLMVAGAAWVRHRPLAWGYRLAAHALLLGWLAKEFGALPLGTGAVTLAWGIYGAVLLLLALRWRGREGSAALQIIAFTALGLAVLKLLFVDLHRVAMVWRILLFLGFGGALLGLSSLVAPSPQPEPERPGRSDRAAAGSGAARAPR
ncbi:MAG TPA: DUF2339 domain-containing protein, partial [Longimicrobiaceae bacterium]|nr:DUF2339 domain-containing protein [Longimicrobiaceae bacterium]